MIKYSFKCSKGHEFDSWVQSAKAFEKLKISGMILCAVCGDKSVERALMAPQVRPAKNSSKELKAGPLSGPLTTAEQAFTELKKTIEENTEDVGSNFATEARAIHDGDAEERNLRGKATTTEVKSLLEDGIKVAPLPWRERKTN